MRTINCWDDMEQFGIRLLTGEACGYAMRLLCDVTEDGKRLIQAFLGGNIEIKPGSNWNGGNVSDPHVGSILLPRGILMELGAFALLKTGTEIVVTMGDDRVCEMDRERFDRYAKMDSDAFAAGSAFALGSGDKPWLKRVWRRSSDPGTGDRNTHAFSGRTE